MWYLWKFNTCDRTGVPGHLPLVESDACRNRSASVSIAHVSNSETISNIPKLLKKLGHQRKSKMMDVKPIQYTKQISN